MEMSGAVDLWPNMADGVKGRKTEQEAPGRVSLF